MLQTVEESTPSEAMQPNASALQQPRNDLQPTNPSAQTGQTGSPELPSAITQDQLSASQLRVGDSERTIQNTTSTAPNFIIRHDYINAAWLWMIIPIVLAVLLFWPRKKVSRSQTVKPDVLPASSSVEIASAQPPVLEDEAVANPALPKKTKKKPAKRNRKQKR